MLGIQTVPVQRDVWGRGPVSASQRTDGLADVRAVCGNFEMHEGVENSKESAMMRSCVEFKKELQQEKLQDAQAVREHGGEEAAAQDHHGGIVELNMKQNPAGAALRDRPRWGNNQELEHANAAAGKIDDQTTINVEKVVESTVSCEDKEFGWRRVREGIYETDVQRTDLELEGKMTKKDLEERRSRKSQVLKEELTDECLWDLRGPGGAEYDRWHKLKIEYALLLSQGFKGPPQKKAERAGRLLFRRLGTKC